FQTFGRTTPCYAEIVIQLVTMKALHTLGQVAQQEAGIQHLIVKREISNGHQVQTGLALPVPLAQLSAQHLEFVTRRLALPVGLQSELQFPFGANARKAKIMNRRHVLLSIGQWIKE